MFLRLENPKVADVDVVILSHELVEWSKEGKGVRFNKQKERFDTSSFYNQYIPLQNVQSVLSLLY